MSHNLPIKLFDTNRHFKRSIKWNENTAQEFIVSTAVQIQKSFSSKYYFSKNKNDLQKPLFESLSLYSGAAGIVWGLKHLTEYDYCNLQHDYSNLLSPPIENYLETFRKVWPTDSHLYTNGLLMGSVGLLVANNKFCYSAEVTNLLYESISNNSDNPVCEYMWAASGGLAVALDYYNKTNQSKWLDLYLKGVDILWSQLIQSTQFDCKIWSQLLYGHNVSHIGAVHGFAGNAFAIIKGKKYITSEKWNFFATEIRNTIIKTALIDEQYANWPQSIDGARPGRTDLLVQHCHGAPGIIIGLSLLLDGEDLEFDQLLLKAGELIWLAGPLLKGWGLCHGTAGNGYAFLKLYRQTGDKKWLARARVFAMVAIEQSTKAAAKFTQSDFSLWDGDIGVALFVLSCIEKNSAFPTMDVF